MFAYIPGKATKATLLLDKNDNLLQLASLAGAGPWSGIIAAGPQWQGQRAANMSAQVDGHTAK
jgi:hypothetical protein